MPETQCKAANARRLQEDTEDVRADRSLMFAVGQENDKNSYDADAFQCILMHSDTFFKCAVAVAKFDLFDSLDPVEPGMTRYDRVRPAR